MWGTKGRGLEKVEIGREGGKGGKAGGGEGGAKSERVAESCS